jgi:release factor glutamine methyltransferase
MPQERFRAGGRLYFEINPLYAEPLLRMLAQKGFTDIRMVDDQFGKQRFIACKK